MGEMVFSHLNHKGQVLFPVFNANLPHKILIPLEMFLLYFGTLFTKTIETRQFCVVVDFDGFKIHHF